MNDKPIIGRYARIIMDDWFKRTFGTEPNKGLLIMLLKEEENIREVIPFPMSGTAQDLMCGAPNEVTEQQLREVHIKVRQ